MLHAETIAPHVRDIRLIHMKKQRKSSAARQSSGKRSDTETALFQTQKSPVQDAGPKTGAGTMLPAAVHPEGSGTARSVRNIPAATWRNALRSQNLLIRSAAVSARQKSTGSCRKPSLKRKRIWKHSKNRFTAAIIPEPVRISRGLMSSICMRYLTMGFLHAEQVSFSGGFIFPQNMQGISASRDLSYFSNGWGNCGRYRTRSPICR